MKKKTQTHNETIEVVYLYKHREASPPPNKTWKSKHWDEAGFARAEKITVDEVVKEQNSRTNVLW